MTYYIGTEKECLALQKIEDDANGLPLPGVRHDGSLDYENGVKHIRNPQKHPIDELWAFEMFGDLNESDKINDEQKTYWAEKLATAKEVLEEDWFPSIEL